MNGIVADLDEGSHGGTARGIVINGRTRHEPGAVSVDAQRGRRGLRFEGGGGVEVVGRDDGGGGGGGRREEGSDGGNDGGDEEGRRTV